MDELLYPKPNHFSYTTRKRITYALIITAFLGGMLIGTIHNLSFEISEPVVVFDPSEIPSSEQIENNLTTFTVKMVKFQELKLDRFGRYWAENNTLFIRIHNSTMTEFYFDRDLVIVTSEPTLFEVSERYDALILNTEYFPVMLTLWFWQNN